MRDRRCQTRQEYPRLLSPTRGALSGYALAWHLTFTRWDCHPPHTLSLRLIRA